MIGSNSRFRPCMITHRRRGATMVLIAVLLPVLIAVAAFAINIAHFQSLNTDVQIASDAASLAASQAYFSDGDEAAALAAARDAAARNPIGETVLPIAADDLQYGFAERKSLDKTYDFKTDGNINSVRLRTGALASGNQTDIRPLFAIPGFNMELRSERESIASRSVLDLSLCVDRSGSMAYAIGEPSVYPPAPASAPVGWDFGDRVPPGARWWALLNSLQTLHAELTSASLNERVNLVLYDHESANTVPLGTDYDKIAEELIEVTESYEAGGTNIGGALSNASWVLKHDDKARPFASKVVLLLTDGIHNYGTNPLSAADGLKRDGVTVFTVTFGDEADQATMQEVARRCGGTHHHANNGSELSTAFAEIVGQLPLLITK